MVTPPISCIPFCRISSVCCNYSINLQFCWWSCCTDSNISIWCYCNTQCSSSCYISNITISVYTKTCTSSIIKSQSIRCSISSNLQRSKTWACCSDSNSCTIIYHRTIYQCRTISSWYSVCCCHRYLWICFCITIKCHRIQCSCF